MAVEKELRTNKEMKKRYITLLAHIRATLTPSKNDYLIKT